MDRKEAKLILVDRTEMAADGYGSFLQVFTLDGERYRIPEKRSQLWEVFNTARRGEPVMLTIEEYNKKQYVSDAKPIADELLKRGIQKLGEKIADKVNEERNRSTALSYSKDLVCAGKVDVTELYTEAEKNYQFIKGNV
jgi:hypothetical protein